MENREYVHTKKLLWLSAKTHRRTVREKEMCRQARVSFAVEQGKVRRCEGSMANSWKRGGSPLVACSALPWHRPGALSHGGSQEVAHSHLFQTFVCTHPSVRHHPLDSCFMLKRRLASSKKSSPFFPECSLAPSCVPRQLLLFTTLSKAVFQLLIYLFFSPADTLDEDRNWGGGVVHCWNLDT
jgi:hypothetical protein